jgi:hypothetical protein
MLTFDRVKPKLLCPWWLPHWMAGCKLPLHLRGRDAHGLEEAGTSLEGSKQEEGSKRKESGCTWVCEGCIRDMEGRTWIFIESAQGRMDANGSDRGTYGCLKGLHRFE